MNQEHVDAAATDQGIDLVAGVVPLPVSLQMTRPPLVVGRAEAAPQATDGQRLVAIFDFEPGAVARVEETGQHLGVGLLVQLDEVLVVALDEQCLPRSSASLRPPDREVPGACTSSRNLGTNV